MKPHYLVYNPATSFTRFKHENYQQAKTEAIRLASAHPGQEFLVLAAVATVKKTDVIIDEISPMDHIPF